MPQLPSTKKTVSKGKDDPKKSVKHSTKHATPKTNGVAKTNGQAKTQAKPPVAPAKKPGKGAKLAERAVVYPKVGAELFQASEGKPFTSDKAKSLIGWDDTITDNEYDLVDVDGKKVRLQHNPKNRKFDKALAKTWQSEILQGHWRLNGETMIIGKYGSTVSAQHRLAALILAVQEWRKSPESWPYWKEEPTIDCIVIYGIDEADETVNTIDTGKPRSLSDVIYRSELFAGMQDKDRDVASKVCANALKFFAHRSGSWANAFAPKRTHAEFLDLLERHSRLLDCVKHCFMDNGKNNTIGKLIPVGMMAALMYLMATSNTDPADYRHAERPDEDLLDFKMWDKAVAFVSDIASNAKRVAAIKDAIEETYEHGHGTGENYKKVAVITKAWHCVAANKPINAAALALTYATDEDEIETLDETPVVGGIDIYEPDDMQEHDSEDVKAEDPPAEKSKKGAKKKDDKAEKTSAKKPAKDEKWEKGDMAYVLPEDGENMEAVWQGKIVDLYPTADGDVAKLMVQKGFTGAGKTYEASVSLLVRKNPNAKK